MKIEYRSENSISVAEFKDILERSTLAERRPVNDYLRLEKMCANANLIVTARYNGVLIGIARSLTDFVFCTYLSDLAVDNAFQKKGIGRELIRWTKIAAGEAKLILLAAPAAINYYSKIGMTKFEQCYYLDDILNIR